MGQSPQLLDQNLGYGAGPLCEKPKLVKKRNKIITTFSFYLCDLISAHRILAGSEVLQSTAGSFQGGIFLGQAKETQVGMHRFWVAQPIHTRWCAFFGHLGQVKGKLGKNIKKRSEEEIWLLLHDQHNSEQRWHLFLSLGARRAEAANGVFLPVQFRISLWLVLLETLGTFSLQLVGQVMEDAHTVFHRLVKAKDSNHDIIFWYPVYYFSWSEHMLICNIRSNIFCFFYGLFGKMKVYYSQTPTSFVDSKLLNRNLRIDRIPVFLVLWVITAKIMARSYTLHQQHNQPAGNHWINTLLGFKDFLQCFFFPYSVCKYTSGGYLFSKQNKT